MPKLWGDARPARCYTQEKQGGWGECVHAARAVCLIAIIIALYLFGLLCTFVGATERRGGLAMRNETPELLTAGEEIALARRIRGTDPADALEARNELVLRNGGLIGRIVRKLVRARPSRDEDDLFSEGMLALLRAADAFDPDRFGTRFSTLAVKAIRNHLRNYIARESQVRVPSYIQEHSGATAAYAQTRKSAKAVRSFERNLERAAAARAGMLSLSAPENRKPGAVHAAPIDPAEPVLERLIVREGVEHIMCAWDGLQAIPQYVISRRFGLGGVADGSLQDIGSELNLCRERIRQIESAALRQLSGDVRTRAPSLC
jgi:RNA polymerase primary sigma factor